MLLKRGLLLTFFSVLLLAFVFHCITLSAFAVEPAANDRGAFSRSTVSDILDSLVNATYFKDEHFSAPSKDSDKFGFPSSFVPQYSD